MDPTDIADDGRWTPGVEAGDIARYADGGGLPCAAPNEGRLWAGIDGRPDLEPAGVNVLPGVDGILLRGVPRGMRLADPPGGLDNAGLCARALCGVVYPLMLPL